MKCKHITLLPGLHRFEDTCNVYVVCDEHESIAIDFGSGNWLNEFSKLNLPPIKRVYLTHHHADQCAGLAQMERRPFEIHAPVGEDSFYLETSLRQMRGDRGGGSWFPESYDLLEKGFRKGVIIHDLGGFRDHHWLNRRVRFLHTPGHGEHAISIVLDHEGKQLVFCGDAAHDGATVHQPYCMDWDHWQATGAQAALNGVRRLRDIGMDMLLPSHGPIVTERPRTMLRQLARKLEKLVEAKGSVCAGEKDHYVTPHRFLKNGAKEILPNLFWFSNGGYLLRSQTGEALITDPAGDLSQLRALLKELPDTRITAQTVTHIHGDHVNAVEAARNEFGATFFAHPLVGNKLKQGSKGDVPYQPREPIHPDHLWPKEGKWQWNEYTFRVGAMPGQTWWHCGFMTTIANRKVLFGGDTFQPASRWNGTGGFSSINGCRFKTGFEATARKIIDWAPDIIVNGHVTWRHYRKSYFKKAIQWSRRTEAALIDLCPSGKLAVDYYLHSHR